jgi:hypothetical protein
VGKPIAGGSGGSGGSIFASNVTKSGTYGTADYIDFGVIPAGYKIWFGVCQFASPDKSGTFEVRTSKATKAAGNDTDTTLLGTISAGPRTGTVNLDLYKSNSLHTVSVIGTGVEKFWVKAKSKSSTSSSYYASINYTLE